MRLSEKDIKIIQQYFTDKPVKKAFIFGSYARNEADAESDVDILVELDYTKHIGLGFVKMKLELEEQLHKHVDLVSNQAVSKHLLPFINSDKQLVYEREAG
jgi:predicted nucleotidyltransferase